MALPIGRVTHFYDKIGVAIVAIEKQTLKIGDKIKFSGHDQEFTQSVDSMQTEHQQIPEAKVGMVVGIQTERKVKENDRVFLVT